MKYFAVSDLHSFATELKASLRLAGYNKKNKDHVLIVCGDVFDRGDETLEIYKYLVDIPKKRRILIRGNHELLFLKLLKKSFPDRYDFSNGTVKTFCHIAQMPIDLLEEFLYNYDEQTYLNGSRKAWQQILAKVTEHPITAWLKSTAWVNYYEVGRFIFVHSFIPTIKAHINQTTGASVLKDWRHAPQEFWDAATWECPWELYKAGLFQLEEDSGKTLVCGHWHTSDFYKHLKAYHGFASMPAPIYYSKGLIGLDSGVMRTWDGKLVHPQNVLVINDPNSYDCYDESSAKLIEMEAKFKKIIRTVSAGNDTTGLPAIDDFLGE